MGALLLSLCTAVPVAHADSSTSFSVLHTFSSSEGSVPSGPLLQGADGRYYGNAATGGSNGLGTVYAVTSTGALTVLHDFAGSDGTNPTGPLIAGTDGTLYGVTEYGGDNDAGTVFSITASGRFTVLHSFAVWANGSNTDGMAPRGGLTLGSDGNFYGATTRGGSNDGGTLFRITPAGVLTTLYTFSAFNSTRSDGALPATPLALGKDGRFHGTTAVGGTHSSGGLAPGTLYAIGLNGSFSAQHSFTYGVDGSSPSGLVAASDGTFYGATSIGGPNGTGTLFKATSKGSVTTLYSFSAAPSNASGLPANSDGAYPASGVLLDSDGTLYGGTIFGGKNGTGSLFSLAPDNTFTVLYQFSSATKGINSDGAEVVGAPIRGSDGNLYGVAALGGSNGIGVIYKLTMPALPVVTLTLGAPQVNDGASTSLTWSASDADTCTASDGWSGSQATSGSVTVTPSSTTTYTLSCRNVSGTASTSTTLDVTSGSSTDADSGTETDPGTGTGTGGSGVTTDAASKGAGSGGGAMPLGLITWAALASLLRRRRIR